MHRRLGRILGLAVVLAGLTGLMAYDLAASNVEGKVVEIDSAANRVVVQTVTGSKVTLMADPQTMILSGNDSKRLSDIHVGDQVKVSYTTAGSTNTATDIEMTAASGTVTGSNTSPSGSTYGSDTARANTNTNTYDSDTHTADMNTQKTGSDMNRTDTYHTTTGNTSGSTYDSSHTASTRSGNLPQTGSSLGYSQRPTARAFASAAAMASGASRTHLRSRLRHDS